ncbi:RNA 3'-terminal phosphate cyclase [Auriculariales sp. MPI-PUGE-AT-0066]|nr:RNA 3'-terminal phosphate cyclase [Auriculariales sp. MPI-PUGE-AT-0066]
MASVSFQAIEGGTLEGGGQLLRNSVALSTLLCKPIEVHNIRAGRHQPGLKAQHAAGIQLVTQLSNATTEGAGKGSKSLKFSPGHITPGSYTADPGTAGSTTLLLQISLPCLLFSDQPSSLTLRGGTNASNAPQIDYTLRVLLPFLSKRFGLDLDVRIGRRGYFPKGGGEVQVTIPESQGKPLPALTLLERGKVTSVKGYAFVAGLPATLANEMQTSAQDLLRGASEVGDAPVEVTSVREDARSAIGSGSGIVLWAETANGCIIAGSALGQKGKSFGVVAKEAVDELISNLAHGGCVDEYLQDQMIVFMALAEGKSSVACGPLTLHTKTAIWVAEQLTEAKFEIEECSETRNVIHCAGIGFMPELPKGL